MEYAKGMTKPTYPKYSVGGCIANAGSCNTGFMSAPFSGANGRISVKGLEVNNRKTINPKSIRLIMPIEVILI